jgi:hypothetical protein
VTSRLQVAGIPHVVGCVWPAGDSECVEVSRRFYMLMFQRRRSASRDDEVSSALQEAVMVVCAEEINMLLNRAPPVHHGV